MSASRGQPHIAEPHFDERLVVNAVFQVEGQFALKIRRHFKRLWNLCAVVAFQGQGRIHSACINPVDQVIDRVDGAFHFGLKFQVPLPGVVVDDAGVLRMKQAQVKFKDMPNVLSNAGIGKDIQGRRVHGVAHVEKNPFKGT